MSKYNTDKRDRLIFDGFVVKADRGGIFLVELENGNIITAKPSGKIQKNLIKIIVGDKVTVELGQYEPSKGRIITRIKA